MPKSLHSAQPQHSKRLSRKALTQGFWMWALASLFYFYDYLLQVSPGAMKPELFEAFNLTAVQFGSISALFHYAYGAMQIPAGMLLDQFGPRRLLTLACVLSALGCFWFGIAAQAWEAQLSRLLMGLGASFALMGCFKIASVWFPPERFAFITGSTVTVGFLGAVLGLSMVSKTLQFVDWRDGMRVAAWIGFLGAIALFLVVRDHRPGMEPKKRERPTFGFRSLWQGLKTVSRHRRTWYASLYSGLMFCPTLAFSLWGVPFLVEAHGYDRHLAGSLSALIYVGWVFGAPFFGWISDKIHSRLKPLKYASYLTFSVCLALIYLCPLPAFFIGSLLFLLGFLSSGFILSFVIVRESNPSELTGTALGFINTINTLAAALFQPLIGLILESSNAPLVVSDTGERIFAIGHYQQALFSLLLALGLAILLLSRLKETYPKPV